VLLKIKYVKNFMFML